MIRLALVAATLLAAALLVRPVVADEAPAPDRVGAPTPIADVVLARPFTVERSFTHWWRAERPEVEAGWLLVLRVAEEHRDALLRPRQTAMPVLFVGDQTARRVNVGHGSGHLVVIVPSAVRADGTLALDLAQAPIWFGSAMLPEQVDAATIADERFRADEAGLRAAAAPRLELARRRGGESLPAVDEEALLAAAIDLVERFCPDERDLVRGFRQTDLPEGVETGRDADR